MVARKGLSLVGAILAAAGILAATRAGAQQAAAQWSPQGGIVLRGRIVTMDDQGDVIDGALYIQNGVVQQILGKSDPAPAGAFDIATPGYIYPGLLNLHNHMIYDFLPPYPVPQDFGDRDEWPSGALYEQLVNNPKTLVTSADFFNDQSEAIKWGEVKELVGGVTSVQGTPADAGAQTILVRNVELGAMGGTDIADRVTAVDQHMVDTISNFRSRVGGLTAWFFHLAEGKDDHARFEYSNPNYDSSQSVGPNNRPGLKDLGMVLPALVGIHCTGLTETEFADWEQTTGGAKIVWSPLSNLMLYGQTTDVLAAMRHNATIALGTDWTPSGNKNLLWELKVADQYNQQRLGGALTTQQLAWMVTRNPAKILGWQDKVGSIAQGMIGDVVMLDDLGSGDPYRNLIDSTETNVELVCIGGEPLYGDASVLQALKGASPLEALNDLAGRPKALDLQRPSVPKGGESLADIEQKLAAAASESPDALAAVLNTGDPSLSDPYTAREKMAQYLVQNLGGSIPPELNDPAHQAITASDVANYISIKFPNAQPIALDPIFEQTDDAFWTAVKGNLHFQGSGAALDLTALDRYRSGGVSTTTTGTTGSGTSGTSTGTGTTTTGTTGAGTTGTTGTGTVPIGGHGSHTGTGASGAGTSGAGTSGAGTSTSGATAASTAGSGTSTGSGTGSSGGGGGGGCVVAAGGHADARDLAPLAGLAFVLLVIRRRRRAA